MSTPSNFEARAREIVGKIAWAFDLNTEFSKQYGPFVSAIAKALEEERERCAEIADDSALASREIGLHDMADVAQQLASAIRNQKDQSDA